MQRIPSKVQNHAPFQFVLQLHPTTDAVVEHNLSKLHANMVNLWPPSKLSTLVPIPPKLHLMMQEDCIPLSVWFKEHVSCSHLISGLMLAWSMVR